jgi:hypothetical protein
MGLQFSGAVEDTEIWSAIGDGFSFAISYESPTAPASLVLCKASQAIR